MKKLLFIIIAVTAISCTQEEAKTTTTIVTDSVVKVKADSNIIVKDSVIPKQ